MQPTVYPQKSIIIGAKKRDPLAVDARPRRRWPLPHPFAQVGMALATLLLLLCIGAPLTAPHDPSAVNLALGLQPPSARHWLGTDQFGRDVWSRVLWAGNTSITVTVSVLTLTTLMGLAMGLVSGYRGGWSMR
jgi:peptide/nickel transport system permease protein